MNNIRYVHNPRVVHKKYNGFTIAYTRDETKLIYGYTLCIAADTYEKSIGRIHATRELENYIKTGTGSGGILVPDDVRNYIRAYHQDMLFILADQCVEELNMMDFKHAFISAKLNSIVNKRLYAK